MEVDEGEKQKYYSKKYSCKTCGKTFLFKSNLITHECVHTDDKPHECDICGKTFSFSTDLNVHKKTHTGEKSYECELCDMTFTSSGALKQHTRRRLVYHKMIKTKKHSLLCFICGAKFNGLSELISHKEIHLNDKLYSCDVCQTTYTTQSVLILHNKTAAHLKRKESLNLSSSTSHTDFIDCGEVVKVEDIKEEIKEEEESVDDPLTIQGETTKGVNENIVM